MPHPGRCYCNGYSGFTCIASPPFGEVTITFLIAFLPHSSQSVCVVARRNHSSASSCSSTHSLPHNGQIYFTSSFITITINYNPAYRPDLHLRPVDRAGNTNNHHIHSDAVVCNLRPLVLCRQQLHTNTISSILFLPSVTLS